jgi:hypothetical protein
MRKQAIAFLVIIFFCLGIALNLNAQVSSIRFFERKDHNTLSLAVNPANSQIATGGDDQRVILWNTETGQPDAILSGNTGWVTAVDFIQEGKKLIAGDKDGKVVLFDLTTNTSVHTFSAHKGTVFSLDWNATSNLMSTTGADGMLRIWDLNSRQMIREIKGAEQELLSVRFSSDGSKMITSGSDGFIKEWETSSGRQIRSIEANPGNYVRAACYSGNMSLIASAGDDKIVKIWDGTNGKIIKKLPKEHDKWIQSLEFAADNRHLVSGGHDGSVLVWDTEASSVVGKIKQNGLFVSGTIFSGDLKKLITCGYEGKINLWDISPLQLKPAENLIRPAMIATSGGAGSVQNTGPASDQFDIIQPRLRTGENFVCLEEEIMVRGKASLRNGIREFYVSNKQSGIREKVKLTDGNIFEHAVKLAYLENEITLEAIDTEGRKFEKKLTAYRIFDKTNATELSRLSRSGTDYALVIATNTYSAMSPLTNPVFDANTIAAQLETEYGFNVEKLIDPTLAQITLKIREYARKLYADDDQLFIFIAGHGEYDDFYKEGYLVASDTKKGDEGKTTYLPHSALRTYVNNIPCNHIFLMMDVCFGGTFDPHIASSRGENEIAAASKASFIKRKLKSKTRLYLTSGGKEYVPDGRPGAHSPFARKFLESLGSYGGSDRILTYKEILGFVEMVTPEPRTGEFGDNEPGSDFLFIAK